MVEEVDSDWAVGRRRGAGRLYGKGEEVDQTQDLVYPIGWAVWAASQDVLL